MSRLFLAVLIGSQLPTGDKMPYHIIGLGIRRAKRFLQKFAIFTAAISCAESREKQTKCP